MPTSRTRQQVMRMNVSHRTPSISCDLHGMGMQVTTNARCDVHGTQQILSFRYSPKTERQASTPFAQRAVRFVSFSEIGQLRTLSPTMTKGCPT